MNKKHFSIIITMISIIAFVEWGLSKLSEKTLDIILATTAICASIAKIICLTITLFEKSGKLTEKTN